MRERYVFDYAVVRVVPRVDREEFVNVGVILFARESGTLLSAIELDRERLLSLAPELDLELVGRHLRTVQAIADASHEGGPVAALPAPERFHWLVAPRSTVIQTSPTHVGCSADMGVALDGLMDTLVRLEVRPRS